MMIRDWLNTYAPKNQDEAVSALREIMQEVALAGLSRSGFFEKAAFYGGTALRIFYGLERYSEDLDFSLLKPDPAFSLDTHLKAIHVEFSSLGMNVSIREKKKTTSSQVESAFLKSETVWRELTLEGIIPQTGIESVVPVKIKLEVDIKPPLGFETEEKLLVKPFSFYVKCFALPYLFAGKMHALLFRKWKDNVKGRDWYDLEWYIQKGIPLNLHHFRLRAVDSGDWDQVTVMTEQAFRKLLSNRIETVNMERVKADIARFIPDTARLKSWSPAYFHDLTSHLKITT